jgi:pentatricopeptide repeat protein
MRSRHIKPTSITLGCMVEAVVSNGDAEGAYDLIHQMQKDEMCRDALNAIIYCSVLKGFARQRKMDRVWAVYAEMLDRKMDFSIVTYNTLVDACARSQCMDRVPQLLEDMKRQNIRPNVITYSTMLKGHCQMGDAQKGFAILEQMKAESSLKPDEIMYNSLLDGCAQSNLLTEGLRLLDDMQAQGVRPSNFTLSILVKLLNRGKKLDMAFKLVERLAAKYRIRPNVHVYTNLIQACISHRALARGFAVLEQMAAERVMPDARAFSVLTRGCIQSRQPLQIETIVRTALQLPGGMPLPSGTPLAEAQVAQDALHALADFNEQLALTLLHDIREHRPKLRLDRRLLVRLGEAGA